jgi:hypothetical protein
VPGREPCTPVPATILVHVMEGEGFTGILARPVWNVRISRVVLEQAHGEPSQ